MTQKMESSPLSLQEIFFLHMDTQLLGIILVAFCFQTFYFILEYSQLLASLVALTVERLPAMQETWVRFLDQEDLLGKEMATHSNIAWRIPWTEESGKLQSMG